MARVEADREAGLVRSDIGRSGGRQSVSPPNNIAYGKRNPGKFLGSFVVLGNNIIPLGNILCQIGIIIFARGIFNVFLTRWALKASNCKAFNARSRNFRFKQFFYMRSIYLFSDFKPLQPHKRPQCEAPKNSFERRLRSGFFLPTRSGTGSISRSARTCTGA